MPPPQDLIKEMLLYVLDPNDSDRAFVKFDPKDEVALLINNFGGLSNLELEALTQIALEQLGMCLLSFWMAVLVSDNRYRAGLENQTMPHLLWHV